MTPCTLGPLVTFLHLVVPLLEILVDGICSLLVKPRSLFNWLHRFLYLQSMASCNFDRITTSLEVAALLLAPSFHDLLHLQSACEPSYLAAPLLAPSVDEGFSMLLLWLSNFIMIPSQLHLFLSFWSIASFPTEER